VRRAVAGLPAGLLDGHQAAPPAAARSAHSRWRGSSPGAQRGARRRAGRAHSSLYALICFLCSLYLRNLPRHCLGASCARRRGSAAAPPPRAGPPVKRRSGAGQARVTRRSRSPAPGRTCPGLHAAVASPGGQVTVRRPASTRRSCSPTPSAFPPATWSLAVLVRKRQETHQQPRGRRTRSSACKYCAYFMVLRGRLQRAREEPTRLCCVPARLAPAQHDCG